MVFNKRYGGYYWTPKMLKIGTHRIKGLFLPKGEKKPCTKPSAGGKSKPRYKKAECCPNTGFVVTLP